jgi:multidrug efflux pump subunit AcrB
MAFDRLDLDLGLDADKAALVGVSPAAARRVTRLALAGETAGRFRDAEGDSYDVVVRLPVEQRWREPAQGQTASRSARCSPWRRLGASMCRPHPASAVPLPAIATPRLSSGPASIDRYGQQRSVALTANVESDYLTSKVNADFGARLAGMELPPGYAIVEGGEAQARSESFGGLGGIILFGIFGIFAVLVLEFGRFRETAVVAGVIPLGMFGGLIALC